MIKLQMHTTVIGGNFRVLIRFARAFKPRPIRLDRDAAEVIHSSRICHVLYRDAVAKETARHERDASSYDRLDELLSIHQPADRRLP